MKKKKKKIKKIKWGYVYACPTSYDNNNSSVDGNIDGGVSEMSLLDFYLNRSKEYMETPEYLKKRQLEDLFPILLKEKGKGELWNKTKLIKILKAYNYEDDVIDEIIQQLQA